MQDADEPFEVTLSDRAILTTLFRCESELCSLVTKCVIKECWPLVVTSELPCLRIDVEVKD